MSNRNPIENLGDYNKVREDLQAVGGNLAALYKSIGDTAVFKAAPKLLLGGIAIGAVGVISFNKCVDFVKTRRHKIEKEPELKKEFVKELKEASKEVEDERLTNSK
ncbi:hypothetical protein [Enterocloster lavalensis]|uniref:hypothetical protein n=1 Tax=Enterocloster lavalensis TaxID=460384 RepID=UPI00398413F3